MKKPIVFDLGDSYLGDTVFVMGRVRIEPLMAGDRRMPVAPEQHGLVRASCLWYLMPGQRSWPLVFLELGLGAY